MKKKSTLILFVFLLTSVISKAQITELLVEYGPPAEANVWEKFTIPLTAETFNVSPAEFESVLTNVTSFWIKTEMHTGNDVGGIDDVQIGSTYSSYFNASSEGWSSAGDGTMEWMGAGGYEGGYLQISDWATGAYHWLISPSNWAGDWSAMIGQNIEFWYKTDRPSYAAAVKITSEEIDRLVINTPVSTSVLLGDSTLIQLEVLPAPLEDITVSFSSSNSACIEVPGPIIVPAGSQTAYVYFKSAVDAIPECSSVIEATSSNYITSRITMMVLDNFGIEEPIDHYSITIYPNPCEDKFSLSNTSGISIHELRLYDLSGNEVMSQKATDLSKTEFDISKHPSGIYFLRVFTDVDVFTIKLVHK